MGQKLSDLFNPCFFLQDPLLLLFLLQILIAGNYPNQEQKMKKTNTNRIVQFLSYNTLNIILYVALIALVVFLIKYL